KCLAGKHQQKTIYAYNKGPVGIIFQFSILIYIHILYCFYTRSVYRFRNFFLICYSHLGFCTRYGFRPLSLAGIGYSRCLGSSTFFPAKPPYLVLLNISVPVSKSFAISFIIEPN